MADDDPAGAELFPRHGVMGPLVRAIDWSASPLGPVAAWPPSLRGALDVCLSSRFPMLVWWGPQLVQLYNDAYLPAMGQKHPRALGQPAAECWAEAWGDLGPLTETVLSGGGATYSEDQLLLVERHGYVEESYWTFSYSPIHDEDGGVGGIFVAVNDTTARVLADRRLRTLREIGEVSAAEARTADDAFRSALAVLEGSRADVPFALAYVVDGDRAGAHFVASFGTREGTIAQPSTLPFPDSGRSLWQVARSGEPVLRTGLRERYGGLFVPGGTVVGTEDPDAAMVLPIVASGQSEPVGVLVLGVSPYREFDAEYRSFFELVGGQVATVVSDVLAYQAARSRAEALAELDRVKSEFFANVSHEFRTPLTLIAGPAEDGLADTAEPLPPAQRERMDVIRRNAGRLRRLVDDTLDFARIESGRLHPDTVLIDLAAVTREIVDSFRPAVMRAGLELRVACPTLAAPVAVDPGLWEKIVLNLLSNAVKYTHDGVVEVALGEVGDAVELSVTDTGEGIPAEELPLLFQRFHRVRGAAGRSHEGAGIGLALVDELARLHGGEVTVRSVEGEGSTFTVRLPTTGDAQAGPVFEPAVRRGTAHLDEALRWSGGDDVEALPVAGETAEASVLVVEDNADLRDYLVRLLTPSWRVLRAEDGRAGLAQVREHHPDLVLCDVMMPELDGLGLLRELRADPATAAIPVILLSARAGEDEAVEGLDLGADDYLPKPFNANELVARVRATLELVRLRTAESAFRGALIETLQDGFFVTDARGDMVEVNAAFERITGYGRDGVPYRWPYPWLPQARNGIDRFLRHGGRFTVRVRHRDGHDVWTAVSAAPVDDREGRGRGVVGTIRDVTAERTVADREATVARMAAALAAADDVTEVLTAGLDEIAAVFAAARVVAALWGTGDPLVVATPPVPGWRDLDERARQELELVARRPAVGVTAVPAADAFAGTAGLAAPLGGPEAAVWLDLAAPRVVSGEERALFEVLTGHLGQALGRARNYEQARSVALTLQHAILGPTDLPPGFAVRYEPAVQPLEVGGDWYDVAHLPDGRIGVVVGDCVGRGLPAAAVMGQLRSACQALLLRATGPGQVLSELDAFAARLPGARCTTVFCAIVDPVRGELSYSCGGHLPAVLADGDGEVTLLDQAPSLPLAVVPGRHRPEAVAKLEPGATVLLYTDGLVERRGESLDVGIAAAQRLVADLGRLAPAEVADRIVALQRPAAGYDDDVAVLVYRHPPPPLRLERPAEPAQLAAQRQALREWLATAGVGPEVTGAVVLAVGEACTNAVEHGRRPGRDHVMGVTVSMIGPRLEAVVSDTGAWREPDTDPGSRGRGLPLMRALLDEVTVEHGDAGTTVRMAVQL